LTWWFLNIISKEVCLYIISLRRWKKRNSNTMTSAQGICSSSSQDQQTLLLRFGLSNNDFKGTVSLISSDPPCKYDNVRFTGMRKIPSFFLLKKCFSFCKLLFFTTKPKIKPKMHCLKKQKHAYLSTINYDQCKVVFNLDPPWSLKTS